jgi:tetratricopeptide (TPR) repeat protein
LLARWTKEARRTSAKGKAAAAIALLLAVGLAPASARAQADSTPVIHAAQAGSAAPATGDALAVGRDAYQQALGVSDASARKSAFTRAAASLGEAAQVSPDEPELLADWGNAALGAGDVATATLAYRRALAIDPSNPRARKNLGWLRSRQGDNLRPSAGSATDTLFFFHDWPRGRQLLVGALAFAIAMLLVVPWAGRRRRGLAMLAIIPAAVWLAMTVSVLFEDRHVNDAVVMDAVVLRAADSSGAPAALTQPLPRGTEVVITEKRDTWAKVRLAGGTVGWVPAGAVQRIAN